MLNRRSLFAAMFGAAAAAPLIALAAATPVAATPGMVSADGCHGRPRHCHRGGFRTNSRGRRYVPGAFGKRGRRRRRGRGRRR